MKISNADINLLAQALKENDLSFVEYSDAEFSIKLGSGNNVAAPTAIGNSNFLQNEVKETPKVSEAPKASPVAKESLIEIKVPIVGNLYLAKSPGAKPFVSVGDTISQGDVICIVEAMKVMNEIKADKSGVVQNICVEDGAFVDANTVIMELK